MAKWLKWKNLILDWLFINSTVSLVCRATWQIPRHVSTPLSLQSMAHTATLIVGPLCQWEGPSLRSTKTDVTEFMYVTKEVSWATGWEALHHSFLKHSSNKLIHEHLIEAVNQERDWEEGVGSGTAARIKHTAAEQGPQGNGSGQDHTIIL